MGDHETPASWLERWEEQEPLRLWLWTVACAVIVLAGVAGWLTSEVAVAITGVAAAVLMLGGTAGARRTVYAPLTVRRLLEERLDAQHAESYQRGVQAGIAAAEAQGAPTVAMRVVTPETVPRAALDRCRYVEQGQRCSLPRHPETIGHRLEQVRRAE